MKKSPLRRLVRFGILTAFILTTLYLYSIHTAHYAGTEPVRIDIPQGASMSQITQLLKDKSLINSTTFFKIHARLSGSDRTVQAGRYAIEPNLTPAQILDFLVAPTNGELSVTIPEGFTIFEIDEKLATAGLTKPGDFIAQASHPSAAILEANPYIPKDASLEGFLFPDTYLVFGNGFTPSDLITKMLANFKKQATSAGLDVSATNAALLYEKVTMASILEKEVRTHEDLPTVAGLLFKRINNGWPLQVDASILYERELKAQSANVSRKLSRGDFDKDSPYNTYARLGLPPSPIGNPGLATLKAANNPVDSEYWFYLTDSEGHVHYGRTNAEHEKNKDDFLR